LTFSEFDYTVHHIDLVRLYSELLIFLEPKRLFSQEMAKDKEKWILLFDLRVFSAIQEQNQLELCKSSKTTGPYYTLV
jgi:hypothetical protein